uniref:EF-hand domain-containing protein n=1 Tax=Mucochytrium quahogii TaxID=96639 RepID=A0A7S2W200_9STRA|mmetsp:Transcript_19572/g.32179  ORF Transcript_19572/g.32179 Transcript_19572/m.32179 type:complete len:241 (-) Transcript_19572:885-1607(-)
MDSNSLLGDAAEVRAQIERIKRQVMEGPSALKMVCFLTCAVSLVYDVFDIFGEVITIHPFKMIITGYAGVFVFLGCVLEFQQACCGFIRRWINTWMKILTRVWGRGLLYIVAGAMQLSLNNIGGYICGAALITCGILSMTLSKVATNKLGALHERLIAGHTDDLVYVRQVFNRYDKDDNGYLSPAELASACKEMGSGFTTSELVAIFDYIDADGGGKLSYTEFEAFFTGKTKVNFSAVAL